MWTLFKKSDDGLDVLWVEIDSDNKNEEPHYVLPIFTNTDAAIDFVGDIKFEDHLISMQKINTLQDIANVTMIITSQPASAIILNPPNIKVLDEDKDVDVVYWLADEFLYIIDQLSKMAENHTDKEIIEVLDRYLREKAASPLDI